MWGNGKQTRSFTFIDVCVEGILCITKSDFKEPLNLGRYDFHSWAQLSEITRVAPPPTGSRLGHCGYRSQPSV